MFHLKESYLCKTHRESLFLQTGLWSLGLISATGLWRRQQCLQAETQKHGDFIVGIKVQTQSLLFAHICRLRVYAYFPFCQRIELIMISSDWLTVMLFLNFKTFFFNCFQLSFQICTDRSHLEAFFRVRPYIFFSLPVLSPGRGFLSSHDVCNPSPGNTVILSPLLVLFWLHKAIHHVKVLT